jgi:hypothetical protein
MQAMRVALYWAPSLDDQLGQAGNAWLGRDPERGARVAQPNVPGIAEATAAARIYGFHATLRPPMRLATGWDELMRAAETLACQMAPFDLPPLAVTDFSGFLALRETLPCAPLQVLAESCVRATNPHRLGASAAELAKRRAAGLSPAEDAHLLRWGYPHVMECWRFHMTLSRRLDAAEMAVLRPAAEEHFASSLSLPRRVTDIAVFTQQSDDPPAPFLIAERLPLG